MKIIYTIGYSAFDIEHFIAVLKKYKINSLIDVRSQPHSSHYICYNRDNLETVMKKNKIIYRNYRDEFGARQTNEAFYTNGVMDFEKFAMSQQFINGIEKIKKGIELNYTFVLMCAEKRPEECHRNILVARQFFIRGYEIRNIIEDGSFIDQQAVEKILLDKYYPRRDQLSLFDEQLSRDEMIKRSYQKRNEEIGFKWKDLI